MRGSPLIRFFLLALGLAVTGAGLARLTAAKAPLGATHSATPEAKPSQAVSYTLILSAEAMETLLDTGIAEASATSGTLQLDPENPRVALRVRWKASPIKGEQRFAKLTLESPGQPTITHVFDAAGDIDDLLELPLSSIP